MSTPEGPLGWTKLVRTQLLALTGVADLLGTARVDLPMPGSTPSFFTTHLSHVRDVDFPAISLHTTYTRSRAIRTPYMVQLDVDVWCRSLPRRDATGAPQGESGCWRIYFEIQPWLHESHKRGSYNPLANDIYTVHLCTERGPTTVREDPTTEHLFHLSAKYDVVLAESGACPVR